MTKVLVVEDDPLMLRMYQKIFTLEGYEVDTAENGQEALDHAKNNKPQLILLDIMMPVMNGLQALEKLKKDPDTKEIPVVVITNLAGEQDEEAALSKGAAKYIVKSEKEPNDIALIVKEILDKQNSQPKAE